MDANSLGQPIAAINTVKKRPPAMGAFFTIGAEGAYAPTIGGDSIQGFPPHCSLKSIYEVSMKYL